MSDEADERPRIFIKSETPDAVVVVNVQGSAGEDTEDIEEIAVDQFDHAVQSNRALQPESDEERGVE